MRLRTLVDQLTPGQRWTSATCVVLACLVLRFGMPTLSGDAVLAPGIGPAAAEEAENLPDPATTTTVTTAAPAPTVPTAETTTTTTSTVAPPALLAPTTSTTTTSTTTPSTTTTTAPAPPVECPLPTVAGVCVTPPL